MRKLYAEYPLGVVMTAATVLLLPLLIGRDVTPANELRYLSIADEALANGHFFAFFNHGIPYADKPPLFIWLVMLSKWVTGQHCMLLLSMFSLIPAYIIIYIQDKFLREEHKFSVRARTVSALMLLTSLLFIALACTLRMDMLMVMFIVLSLYSFFKIYKGTGNVKVQKWLLPLWIFMALFSKGPVGFFMPVIVIIAFLAVKKSFRRFGEFLGWRAWGIMLGLFGLWILGVYLDGGTEYIKNLLFHQTIGRAVNAFTHDRPFWFYFIHIWWVAAPWGILSIILTILKWKHGTRTDTEVLFLTAIAVLFVMLSSFSSKLPVYLLPLVPYLIGLIPVILSRCRETDSADYSCPKWLSKSVIITASVIFVAAFGAGLFIGKLNPYIGYRALCEQIPADASVSTLYVSRPENMDVYLHRPLTADFDKDEEAFLATVSATSTSSSSPETPHVLIIKTAAITPSSLLSPFITTHPSTTVGPYTLVEY